MVGSKPKKPVEGNNIPSLIPANIKRRDKGSGRKEVKSSNPICSIWHKGSYLGTGFEKVWQKNTILDFSVNNFIIFSR
ncbi:hypothetical protein B6N58_05405 [Legionella micdadei]|nr:hypothetical protein B6N58_05405 [Legionella micdadei]